MNESELNALFAQILPPDESARAAAHSRWASCAKPLGSLGLLETALEQIAALTGTPKIDLSRRCVAVLCADNGVVAEGVTQTDSSVTGIVAKNLAAHKTAVCRMAAVANCTVLPVDMGILNFSEMPGVRNCRIGNGTANIVKGPAMTRQQAVQAVAVGINLVKQQKESGMTLIATGEMGIGNTTTSGAVACALLHQPARALTGRGAGLSDAGLLRKINVIETALQVNKPNADDVLDVLGKVGGFDLAGLCGIFLGGAIHRVPVLADGFISTVAALCAVRLCPLAQNAILASHVSAEPAGARILHALNKKPLITAEMRLGEGTGAVAAIPLLEMACAVYQEGYTFAEGGIVPYTPQGGAPC